VSYSAGCAAVAPSTLSALTAHFGTLTGAELWIDGPGVQAPMCARITPWPVDTSTIWASVDQPSRSCHEAG